MRGGFPAYDARRTARDAHRYEKCHSHDSPNCKRYCQYRKAARSNSKERIHGIRGKEKRRTLPMRLNRIAACADKTMRRERRSTSVPPSLRSARPIDPPWLSGTLIYIPPSARNALHVHAACTYQHVDDDQPGLANARRPARNAVIIQRLRSPAREASRSEVINMRAGMWENCGAYPRERRGDR